VPVGNPEALADAASGLSTEEKLRRQLAAASLASVPRHTREEQAHRVIDALASCHALAGDHPVGRVKA
jgi:hypothetical protein